MSKRGTRRKRLVFISHSSQDTWVAEQIAKHIKTSGANFFLDEYHIQLGADFEEEILKQLNKSDEILVLLTPWSIKRPYVWAELGVAWGRKIRIVGVLHGISIVNLNKKSEATIFLKKKNLIELNTINKYFSELKKRC
jgi:predicted peroxiredoxin